MSFSYTFKFIIKIFQQFLQNNYTDKAHHNKQFKKKKTDKNNVIKRYKFSDYYFFFCYTNRA